MNLAYRYRALLIAVVFAAFTMPCAAQEYDDMYFTAKDRKSNKIGKDEIVNQSSVTDKGVRRADSQVQNDSYSNTEDQYYTDQYYSDDYYSQERSENFSSEFYNRDQAPVVNNYYGNTYMGNGFNNRWNNPYRSNFGFAWSPFGWSMGFNYGWNYGFGYYDPFFYDPFFYDPFYFPAYSYNRYRWYSPYYNGYYPAVCYYGRNNTPTGEYNSAGSNNNYQNRRGGTVLSSNSNLGRMSRVVPDRSRVRPANLESRSVSSSSHSSRISVSDNGQNTRVNRSTHNNGLSTSPNNAVLRESRDAGRIYSNQQNTGREINTQQGEIMSERFTFSDLNNASRQMEQNQNSNSRQNARRSQVRTQPVLSNDNLGNSTNNRSNYTRTSQGTLNNGNNSRRSSFSRTSSGSMRNNSGNSSNTRRSSFSRSSSGSSRSSFSGTSSGSSRSSFSRPSSSGSSRSSFSTGSSSGRSSSSTPSRSSGSRSRTTR